MPAPSTPPNSQAPRARYVAIIADGNRRWARARRLPVSAGYMAGADTLKARLGDAIELGVEELSIYSFSTENWSRPAEEIGELLSTLAARIERETPELHSDGVRMRFIGRRDHASRELRALMDEAESLTRANRRITLCVAFNYGGRAEIVDAARRFQGGTEDDFRRCFYAPDVHDPDLIIRTGGERRLSNYLLWQAAYSELVFREEMWPDFSRSAFEDSLAHFSTRSRRFGARARTALCAAFVAISCLATAVHGAHATAYASEPAERAHATAYAGEPAERAHAAHVLKATDTAHLHYVSASGSLLTDEGRATGTLPGSMRVHLNLGTTFTGTFTIHTSSGSIAGHGSATPHGSGTYESFSGTLTVTGGTGRYAHARGRGGLYGTFDRENYALVIKTTGSLTY